ncbi:signal sequence receptor alpha chain [Arthroderma uncinatum]|uniref:signal sequence receptor alpha chain n=1 Tax=Arthroderma uncinatum TaxID=74035 RepID=UPI00144AA3E2|nr:signal sequence receptor alpha chain [Arthroderma uncinatum]KAF3483264.1 signal sequence receptor alpha chain [Arthroderma uncinatum]
MGKFSFFSLALLAAQTVFVNGQGSADTEEKTESPVELPKLGVTVSASFPKAEVFGVKLVNGQPTEALLQFSNADPEPVTVTVIGGSLWSIAAPGKPPVNVRNLTATPYGMDVPAGDHITLPYSFATEMHPQDLTLNLAAVISDSKGIMHPITAYNGTVSIVEQDTSIFDPQVLFLYVFLLACSAGSVYFFYTLWIAPYFPQKRKASKGSDRPRKSAGVSSSVDAADQAPATDGTPSTKTYDTEWIPAHHINRPEARKVKSSGGRVKTRA